MATTNIPWCEQVWNPIVGCSKISTGCKNCYAERIAQKLKWTMFQQYENVVDENGWTGELSFSESKLEQPLFLRKPRVIFVNSMGDLFHENMKQEWLDRNLGL
jgi:protein gp37